MTLLEQAQVLGRKRRIHVPNEFSTERVEVALAWSRGEIGGAQVAAVFEIKPSKVTHMCQALLTQGIRRGVLKVEMNGDTA
jgi:hypothetical protein